MSDYRYRVGCAGMFVLGMTQGYDDEDEAVAACESGPMGCDVHDAALNRWIGPTCQEEARL